ncbi:hypothetical protein [Daejeonella sp.]|uniref:hypothetical protein n=1 Tax=Daejeonella sp. TaxID=2805397 RepID=UPI002731EFF1|nr:hypothetical protein [Daejeonella sp.]MDP2415748.1 hypothetical protein [Daejeonella sp.]
MSIKGMFGLNLTDRELRTRIQDLENQIQGNISKPVKSVKSTMPKQLLILHYLGILNTFNLSDRKNSFLLESLLNANADNIRKELPNFVGDKLQEIKNEKHLTELIELFREVGLPQISKTIENDIVKLKKRK